MNGMLALAKGSRLDDVTDIQEDMTEADWGNGKGVVTVSLPGQIGSRDLSYFCGVFS